MCVSKEGVACVSVVFACLRSHTNAHLHRVSVEKSQNCEGMQDGSNSQRM